MTTIAVLTIDVQRGLFETMPPPGDAMGTVERINRVMAHARTMGCPVVLVQHAGTALAPQSEGWRLLPALQTTAEDLRVGKTTPDAFQGTDLDALLRQRGITELVVTGYASEFCIDTTVRRAAALGYAVTLVADAHTTHDKPHATAEQIRTHENATLPAITSFGPRIRAVPTAGWMASVG
ncbi:cysteine hydrolase family protein [Comamonas sp. GB3 AK4-5]|uniref:cysteine hydrolase family protein n=1 Tax=Comamonas sp. GB3 AK4-5 TaxID=3231487 RepID=UPI00351F287A